MAGGINFKFPLRAHRKGFFESNTTTVDAIRENIKTLLLTKKGERLINTGIGTNIPALLGSMFEQIDANEIETKISNEIKSTIAYWIPEVELTFLKVFTEDSIEPGIGTLSKNQILIRMNYVVKNNSGGAIEDSIQLTI
tara:strand:+ start:2383 stop:2799 length:417 start_codon:yes stop_codon:yes gene_type:complete